MTPGRKDLLALFVAALLLRALAAWPQAQPGYMDAAYYTLGAQRLAQGYGFTEMVLWNYLDDPAGLPHPSHLYWMPLPSVLAASSMVVFGTDYHAAQAPFVLLAALVPPLAYAWSWSLARSRRQALAAGGLALFSGYYVVYWGVPEAFAPYTLAGAVCLAASGLALRDGRPGWYVLAGAAAALGHLTRADGVLLLAPVVAPTLTLSRALRAQGRGWGVALALAAYLAVMAPWFARNWAVTGAPLASTGTLTLWLRDYDQLFSYGQLPTAAGYLAWGWGNIVASKLDALWQNLLTFVLANNLVLLTPFTVIGAWRARRAALVWPALVYGALLYAAMTFAFTFPGPRGGVLHSSSALLPALWACAALGLDAAVAAVARRRRTWRVEQAQVVFALGIVLVAAGVSMWLYDTRVLGAGGPADPAWNGADRAYVQAVKGVQPEPGAVFMVNNPPMFTYLTGYPSVVLPNEPPDVLLEAARRYGVRYVVLDAGRPRPLADVYAGTQSAAGLVPRYEFTGADGTPVRVFTVAGR
jgi:4-amino-4-deoxy-L-arabinose transferase-like glycosyltransferase